MNIVLIDVFCLILIAFGFGLLIKGPGNAKGSLARAGSHVGHDPQTYVLRIAGVMLMTFGFAFGLMTTIYHFS